MFLHWPCFHTSYGCALAMFAHRLCLCTCCLRTGYVCTLAMFAHWLWLHTGYGYTSYGYTSYVCEMVMFAHRVCEMAMIAKWLWLHTGYSCALVIVTHWLVCLPASLVVVGSFPHWGRFRKSLTLVSRRPSLNGVPRKVLKSEAGLCDIHHTATEYQLYYIL